jgi:4-alpha-glucanotransferase
MRKCLDRGINFPIVKEKLFSKELSRHGRLRWLNEISSEEILIFNLGKRKEEIKDFIDLYKNSFREKEKLWKLLKLDGPMREKSDQKIVKAVLKYVLNCGSIFVINLITDWLYLGDKFTEDPYVYRFNTPGTVNNKNWSLVLPLSLEKLMEQDANIDIALMIEQARRVQTH